MNGSATNSESAPRTSSRVGIGATDCRRATGWKLIEYFAKHGDVLTHITIANDPVFLEEPLIKNQSFRLNDESGANWLWPCEYVVEVADQEQGDVPHYLPGENPFIAEFAQRHGIPVEAALGGPETTRPEYIETLRAWQAEQQD